MDLGFVGLAELQQKHVETKILQKNKIKFGFFPDQYRSKCY